MFQSPAQTLAEIAKRGTAHLERVIAIDSHSDERSETIPSTEGQKRLASVLSDFFTELGFHSTIDENANLIVEIPSNLPADATGEPAMAPKLALMVHMDTARGTEAVAKLEVLEAWDGTRVPFPANERLQVSVENYPETAIYTGQDLLFGPGVAPIGLDDKLGMAELMTMVELLADNPDIPHGDLVLVFRPDEEIGRMAAVEALAGVLAASGVTRGYTVDGLAPFEVNVENFNAARGRISFDGEPLQLRPQLEARLLEFELFGCKSHGATAKSEGYLNSTVVLARACAPFAGREDIIPIAFHSDLNSEVDARVRFVVRGPDEAALVRAEKLLVNNINAELEPHAWKGARLEMRARAEIQPEGTLYSEVRDLLGHLAVFLNRKGPTPLLSEDSENDEGYSNPCFVSQEGHRATVDYRLRDFTDAGISARKRHLVMVSSTSPGKLSLALDDQYKNMGPSLAPYPELVSWAQEAAIGLEREVLRRPIRGGTGVDPFLAVGIPIANVGTGYFAPESEKEFTTRQNLAAHAVWLLNLVQVVARG